ncbi:peptidoglycan DD-metalloendopeptidase family protein [Pseudoxanthomonas sacheonensis]|uniref:Lipoprotein NlpD n=1 Tax=Pseudoxanthomonas sacheonensis TaxID=443615 RepID=A0ABU1RVW1_9GAMM|nr:peptidoglycan DD-metalloendopeptidase family protein [Pseudoxanthomonas sacheonensis]MDR6842430.1 lipoprotein NlpD [Pseudoxanthomonas sacheonensis]
MTNRSGWITHKTVAAMAVVALLAACSSSVVRETSPSSYPSQRIVSKPKYGATVRVQRGDTLFGVAFRNDIDYRDLAAWNNISSPYTIYPGQSLRLYPPSGGRTAGDTRPATTVVRPAPAVPKPPVAAKPAPGPASSGFNWRWPAEGVVIGRFTSGDATKQGVDIAGANGQAVRAASDGVVVYSGGGLVGYGELIIIKHSESWLSAYGHNRKRLVNEGQNVKAGQQIAEMGRSGASRDMLHFEIRYNGKPVDPLQYLPKR